MVEARHMAEGCDAAPRLTSAAFGAFCDANSSCTLVCSQEIAFGLAARCSSAPGAERHTELPETWYHSITLSAIHHLLGLHME